MTSPSASKSDRRDRPWRSQNSLDPNLCCFRSEI
jgi:hypothetical protein